MRSTSVCKYEINTIETQNVVFCASKNTLPGNKVFNYEVTYLDKTKDMKTAMHTSIM